MTPLITLPAPQILELAGADALAFAQAQFSSNLAELANGHWQWSAWLSAQGRVRAFFHLLRDADERLRLVLRGGGAAQLGAELSRYVLRAKVRLDASENRHAYAVCDPRELHDFCEIPAGSRIATNGNDTCITLPGKTPRWLLMSDGPRGGADQSAAARNENALADIDAGLIALAPELREQFLPLWIGLDTLGAISTNKGCYPGQEIVARLHFKGGNKRRLQRIAVPATTLPEPGARIDAEGEAAATIVCSAWLDANTAAALAIVDARDEGREARDEG
jgi:folate-binding protein YgfZ